MGEIGHYDIISDEKLFQVVAVLSFNFFNQLLQQRGSANKIWLCKGFRDIFLGPKGFRIEEKVEKHWNNVLQRLQIRISNSIWKLKDKQFSQQLFEHSDTQIEIKNWLLNCVLTFIRFFQLWSCWRPTWLRSPRKPPSTPSTSCSTSTTGPSSSQLLRWVSFKRS